MTRIPGFVLLLTLLASSVSAQVAEPARPDVAPAPSSIIGDTSFRPPAQADPFAFGTLVRDLGRNIRDLPSVSTAILLGVGGGAAAWVRSEDGEVTHRWSSSPPLDPVFQSGAVLGGGLVQGGGSLGVYLVGRVTRHEPTVRLGADLVRAQAVNALLTQGLKLSVRRTRPDGTAYSFPSGHTSGTFATATVLQRHYGWKVGIPAYAFATYVGGSRLQANRHYLSDVLFGAAVGIVSGRTVTVGHGRRTFAIAPMISAGGAGISASLIP